MTYRLAVFDFDGTLADSYPWLSSLQEQVIQKYHLPHVQPTEVERMRGFDIKQIMKLTGVSPWKMARMSRYTQRLMAEQIDQIRLFHGIDHMLAKLTRKGVILAVVSSNSRENVCGALGPANTACFTYFECGVALFGKAAKLRKLLRQSGVQPSEAIMIGDEIRDLEAAQAVHMKTGAVSWGFNHPAALRACAPDLVFSRVEEIGEALT